MPSITQLYVLQIAAFVLTNVAGAILGDMLFTPLCLKKLFVGGGCLMAALTIFYVTRPL